MSLPAEMLVRAIALPPGESVSRDDAERVLQIACLAVAADGKLAREEEAALHSICKHLGVDRGAVEELVARALVSASREDRLERLRAAADALTSQRARQLAYKVTVVTALADLASADEEFEFDLDVQDALGLATDEADRLAGEVHAAITPDDGVFTAG